MKNFYTHRPCNISLASILLSVCGRARVNFWARMSRLVCMTRYQYATCEQKKSTFDGRFLRSSKRHQEVADTTDCCFRIAIYPCRTLLNISPVTVTFRCITDMFNRCHFIAFLIYCMLLTHFFPHGNLVNVSTVLENIICS